MKFNVYSTGRTGRTIVYETLHKRIRKTVVLYPDNSSEVKIIRNIFPVIF